MADEIISALSPEEWEQIRIPSREEAAQTARQLRSTFSSPEDVIDAARDNAASYLRRFAAAGRWDAVLAVANHLAPNGCTREDVKTLRDMAEFADDSGLSDYSGQMATLAARIAALLPPPPG